MPSLYYYFIYVLKFFSLNENNVSNYIILFQILLSLASVAIFYRLLCNFLSKRFSIILTSIFLFFPLNVYASIKISSITLQIFLLINFFYFLIEFLNKKKFIYIFFFSFFSGLLILIRGEFFLFYLFSLFYFFLFYVKNN